MKYCWEPPDTRKRKSRKGIFLSEGKYNTTNIVTSDLLPAGQSK